MIDSKPLIISFVSGKGGVGKTMLAVAFARELSLGSRTLLIDLDFFNRGLTGLMRSGRPVGKVAKPAFLKAREGSNDEWTLVADMPGVKAKSLNKLISAFDPGEGRAICVPVFDGKRGNPVLWGAQYFAEIETVAGDVGAKHMIGTYTDAVCEVPMTDDSVIVDLDTPEALAAAGAKMPVAGGGE